MQKPTLAIDIDDVLAQHTRGIVRWHNKNYGTNHTEDDYFTNYLWREVWDVDEEEAERRAIEFHNDLEHGRFEVIEGAKEALTRLATKFNLVVVTIRRKVVIPTTHDWLNRHFKGLIADVRFVSYWETSDRQTKAELCQELRASYLIDDSLDHCLRCAEAGIPSILFGVYRWNKSESLPAPVKRAKNWDDVVGLLDVK